MARYAAVPRAVLLGALQRLTPADHALQPDPFALQQPIIADGEVVVTDGVEVLKKVAAGALYPEGGIRSQIDEWLVSSVKLAASVSQWLLAGADQRSGPESAALQVLESVEAAAAKSSFIAGDQLTAADVAVAAAAAGFYFCVRSCVFCAASTSVGLCSRHCWKRNLTL